MRLVLLCVLCRLVRTYSHVRGCINSDDSRGRSSQQQHNEDTQSSSLKTRADLERVRIKVELARLRSSDAVDDIPSGRVFDSPPEPHASASAAAAEPETEATHERTASTTSTTTTQRETDAQQIKAEAPPRDGVDMLAQAALLNMDDEAPATDAYVSLSCSQVSTLGMRLTLTHSL